jgi:phosphoribosylformimino-5-aminoimidazole carboxamide ribotide isomerase
MRIIPAIDLIDGKCVRLTKGDYATKKVYNEDPVEVAKAFIHHGVEYLHLVDLDGARSGRIVNHKVLERIASLENLRVDFGGGLKSDEDLHIAFESGANQVTGGSIAVKEPDRFTRWLIKYGADKIILGADTRNGSIAVSGWKETSEEQLIPFIEKYLNEGISYVICTDISKDGMLEGAALDLYGEMLNRLPPFNLIASGGVTTLQELDQLRKIGCEGAIVGKAIYEGSITLKSLEDYIVTNN